MLLCHDAVLLLHDGHESRLWDLLTLFSHLYSVFAGFTESSCVSPTAQKKPGMSNQFLSCNPSDYFWRQIYSNIADNLNT